ncbi:GntR family transcriptional regulator [Actinomycetospora endophytica]|uniref:GntR family transcriptional regulator n=1 Tax=Actinomycetospora endophytica TaxID=2291215 RepID=A0ABS8PAN8_9PSEU|nr:GntR family transcriptional regulator [Actinomycetospora endophytica]MCD2195199.1 GntR family transcriptional regulator [Actinomycetospora endophytica]
MPAEAAADRAYAMTKELVLTGDLPGGHLFSEGDIAERLGISRTPVREAFLRLQAEELLVLIPKRGAVVAPVPPGEAEDVLDAREAVETAAVRRMLRRPDRLPEVIGTLRGAIAEQERYTDAAQLEAFAQADEAFHRAIVGAGRNALTTRFYATLADRQRRMSVHALGPSPDLVPVILDQHRELVGLIEAHDESGFAHALRAHLDGTHRR